MLAMGHLQRNHGRLGFGLRRASVQQFKNEFGASSASLLHPYLGPMSLHDLIDDSQPQTCTAFEVGLKGLKNLVDERRGNTRTAVSNGNAPEIAGRPDGNGNRPLPVDSAHRIGEQVPEHLLDAIAIDRRVSLLRLIVSDNRPLPRSRAIL